MALPEDYGTSASSFGTGQGLKLAKARQARYGLANDTQHNSFELGVLADTRAARQNYCTCTTIICELYKLKTSNSLP